MIERGERLEIASIAAGGDGTLNEVVNGIGENLGEGRVGLIPLGTGNDFARSIADRYWVMSRGEIVAGGDAHDMETNGVRELIAGLNAENRTLAIELANLPDGIRGYGHVKENNLRAVRAKWNDLAARWRKGDVARHAA